MDHIHSALLWLKAHNTLYKDIELNEMAIEEMRQTPTLPFHVQHILLSDAQNVLQSRYDDCGGTSAASQNAVPYQTQQNEEDCEPPQEIPFEKVVITDVHGHAYSNELLAAAVRHVKNKGGSYIEIGHESHEFNNTTISHDLFHIVSIWSWWL